MTKIAPEPREDVELDDRGGMTPARKRRIWESRDGKCWMCGQAVPQSGPDVIFDHKIPLELGGSDEDRNIYPLHRKPCDEIKTKADRARIDKMRRQRAKLHAESERTVSPAWRRGSRPFPPPIRIPAKRGRHD